MNIIRRPQSLDELVGQETIKKKLRIAMGAAMQRNEPLPHVLLTSNGGGLGKTTLASIISNEMLCTLHTTTGQCLSTTIDLKNILIRLEPHNLLLIDEGHCIGRAVAEELLVVTEQNILNISVGGQGPMKLLLPPHTIILATTCPQALSAPLTQRFGLHFHLDFYQVHELAEMVKGMASHMDMEFDELVCAGIASRAKGIPRIALRITERVRDVAQARQLTQASMDELELAMQIEGCDDLGLERSDRHCLRVLALAEPRPIGVRQPRARSGNEHTDGYGRTGACSGAPWNDLHRRRRATADQRRQETPGNRW